MKYYTIKQTYYCPTDYGLYECRLENGREVCKLVACVVKDSLTTPI